jgi:MFS family permease
MQRRILITIVIAQFFCTSLWFAGNAIMSDLAKQHQLEPGFLAYLTNAVQFGFIVGTLVFAILAIADRFSPSKVFFCCALIAALLNLGVIFSGSAIEIIVFRFCTGFFLAGIYPVGMKIASDYTESGLGKSLGFLVGALVLGTSFPHLLKSIDFIAWPNVLYLTSSLSLIGGTAMLILVPNGPYRKKMQQFQLGSFFSSFKSKQFKAVAFGYFGHQWELYTFWVFIPVILGHFQQKNPSIIFNIPLFSFAIIGLGCLACMASGIASQHFGIKRTAAFSLSISGACCLISPLVFVNGNLPVLIIFLSIWSLFVVSDSPLFSTLIAQHALPELKGSSMTIVICIGFAITMVSIQLLSFLITEANANFIYMILALGPIFGLLSLRSK